MDNVADDEPVTKREHADVLAAASGARRPVMAPAAMVRVAGARAQPLSRSLRISNRRLKDATGWTPRFPSVRDGLPVTVNEIGTAGTEEVGVVNRVLPVPAALSSLMLGMYALVSPSGFYEDFPFGRGWVSADGPYNEHLLYHLNHLDAYEGFDKVAIVVSLSIGVVIPAAVLVLTRRRPDARVSSP